MSPSGDDVGGAHRRLSLGLPSDATAAVRRGRRASIESFVGAGRLSEPVLSAAESALAMRRGRRFSMERVRLSFEHIRKGGEAAWAYPPADLLDDDSPTGVVNTVQFSRSERARCERAAAEFSRPLNGRGVDMDMPFLGGAGTRVGRQLGTRHFGRGDARVEEEELARGMLCACGREVAEGVSDDGEGKAWC